MKHGLTALAFALVAAACATEPSAPPATAPQLENVAAFKQQSSAERPMQGHCVSTFQFLPRLPGDAPNVARLRIEYYRCNMTHLGRSTGVAEQRVEFGPDGVARIRNTTTYTASNGDRLYARFEGLGVPGPAGAFQLTGVETYAGGTGRFVDATGSASLRGTAVVGENRGEVWTDGGISY